MIYRLTDFIKNSINNFLSQELSPDEIEEMRLNEGLRLEDVKVEEPVDVYELLDHNFVRSIEPLFPTCESDEFFDFTDPPGSFSHYMDIYSGNIDAIARWGDD